MDLLGELVDVYRLRLLRLCQGIRHMPCRGRVPDIIGKAVQRASDPLSSLGRRLALPHALHIPLRIPRDRLLGAILAKLLLEEVRQLRLPTDLRLVELYLLELDRA